MTNNAARNAAGNAAENASEQADNQAGKNTDDQQQCALVLVTHTGIGSALLNQAQRIFVAGAEQQLKGQLTDLYLLEVDDDLSTRQLDKQFLRCTAALSGQHKVLMLTDLEGATPASLATRQAQQHGWAVLAGLNLPMLLKAITYRTAAMPELINTIVDGAQDAVRVLQPLPSAPNPPQPGQTTK